MSLPAQQSTCEDIKIKYLDIKIFLLLKQAGETDGWYADSYLRLYLGTRGMRMVEGGRDDDVFLLLDADELPTRCAVIGGERSHDPSPHL